MKTCDDITLDGMPCCCAECHEDGCECVIDYKGERYSVCCLVGSFIQGLGEVAHIPLETKH